MGAYSRDIYAPASKWLQASQMQGEAEQSPQEFLQARPSKPTSTCSATELKQQFRRGNLKDKSPLLATWIQLLFWIGAIMHKIEHPYHMEIDTANSSSLQSFMETWYDMTCWWS